MKQKRLDKVRQDQKMMGGFKSKKLHMSQHNNAFIVNFWGVLIQLWHTLSTTENQLNISLKNLKKTLFKKFMHHIQKSSCLKIEY